MQACEFQSTLPVNLCLHSKNANLSNSDRRHKRSVFFLVASTFRTEASLGLSPDTASNVTDVLR